MTSNALAALDGRLDAFLADLTAPLGRSARHRWAKAYLKGLLLDGARQSIEPLASRTGADVESLRQFVGQSPWAAEEIQGRLAGKVVDMLAEPEVWMIVMKPLFPRPGRRRWEWLGSIVGRWAR